MISSNSLGQASRFASSLRALSFYDLIVILGFVTLYCMQLDGFLDDPGLGWHLANGQQILLAGKLPESDLFLASLTQRPWVADQWLADMLMSWLHKWGSWPLLSAVLFALFFLTFFLFQYRFLRTVKSSPLCCGLAVLIVFKASQVQFVARPLLFGFLFFSLLVFLLYRHSSGMRLKKFTIIALPLFLLWSCVHPSFVLGIFLLFLYVLGHGVDFLRGVKDAGFRLSPFVWFSVLCILITLLNPYGFRLHETIIWLGGSEIRQLYSEWQPLSLHKSEGFFFILIAGGVLLQLIFSKNDARGWEVLAFLSFSYMALGAVRMLPYFAIVSSYLFVSSLESVGKLTYLLPYDLGAILQRAWGKLEYRERYGAQGKISLTALLLVLVFYYGELDKFASAQPSPAKFPYKSVEYLKATDSPKPIVVTNTMDFGGFVEFIGQKQILPIIDDRSSLLGDAFYKKHFESLKIGGAWRDWAAQFGSNYLLLKPTQHLSRHLKHCYPEAVVVSEQSAILFQIDRMPTGLCGAVI